MTEDTRDRPAYRLTRHFFNGLFDLGFLSEAGVESFERMIVGICAVFLSFGLLLARVFMIKYANLSALGAPEVRQALLADDAFAMALPMWIVAFVTVLVGHALFPDETDFRVLMALPVTRRLIFTTKLLALGLFAGLFIVAGHVALTPLVTLMSLRAEEAFPVRAAAFGVASLLASVFAVLAVTAINGLLVLCIPRGRLMAASAAVRSAMLCALVLTLPLVGRLSAQGERFASGSEWLYLAPPAWFVGLERVLLGDTGPYFVRLAQIGGAAFALAMLTAAGAYSVLYRHFDRVMLQPAAAPSSSPARAFRWRLPRRDRASGAAYVAIRKFTMLTLRRSVLHQGVLVCLSAAGIGLVLNTLLAAGMEGWIRNGGAAPPRLVSAAIWAPFALIYIVGAAVRAALVLPIEQRANWVFRVTEQDAVRADELRAAVDTVTRLSVLIPIGVLFPLQWLVLGRGAIVALIVGWLCGLVFVEILMKNWARIPFTCSYIPGKRFVPQSVLIGFVGFILFTTAGTAMVGVSLTGRRGSLAPSAVLVGTLLFLRWRRLRKWKETPLMFEDELPTEIHPLNLSAD